MKTNAKRTVSEYFISISPPGMSLRSEAVFLAVGNIVGFLYSLGFIVRYFQERATLFKYDKALGYILKEGAKIEPFVELLEDAFVIFLITAVASLSFIIMRYAYFHQGSKSVYLMKRLPDPTLRHKMSIKAPVLYCLLTLGAMLACFLLYLAIYYLFTPTQCM
ncbi:MAG: hypothetical protein IKA82_00100 [Clostridia bacterium]|nr:hypothetical protein [Clostridia bacterium]